MNDIRRSHQTLIDRPHYIQDEKSDLRGILHRITHVPGQVEKALELHGNGFINLGNFSNTCLGKPSLCKYGMTVSLWLKYKLSQKRQYFLGTGGSDIRQPGFVVYQDAHSNGSDFIAVSVRTSDAVWTTHITLAWDTWTHVLFSWSPRDGLSVYTNGTLAGSSKTFSKRTSSMQNSNTSFMLGRANNDDNKLSKATYDELAIWYLVLTEKEVKGIYSRTSGIDFAAQHAKNIQGKYSTKKRTLSMLILCLGLAPKLLFNI